MTRTVKISGVGRPYLAEEGTETVGVTGLTVAPASASVKVGATTTLTFTVKPDGASDKAISVHSTYSTDCHGDPERACGHGERREAGQCQHCGHDF
ncbi:Ig-like domain-containing protein [Escherichia coli]|uniref:Ig-like domain-containing protein n=1 Tax=Escherichia coli TaxID=562 RepID=UPI00398FC08F